MRVTNQEVETAEPVEGSVIAGSRLVMVGLLAGTRYFER